MPSNEEHKEGGRPVAILLALALGGVVLWQTDQLIYAGVATAIPLLAYPVAIGLPDIDSESSIPRRQLRVGIMGLSILGVGYLAFTNLNRLTGFLAAQISGLGLHSSLLIVLGGTLGVGWLVGETADETASHLLPNHREELHDPLLYLAGGGGAAILIDMIYLQQANQLVRVAVLALLVALIVLPLTHIGQDKIHT